MIQRVPVEINTYKLTILGLALIGKKQKTKNKKKQKKEEEEEEALQKHSSCMM